MTDDATVEAVALAISAAFHEEGYDPEYDEPAVWDEFLKAARAAIAAHEAALAAQGMAIVERHWRPALPGWEPDETPSEQALQFAKSCRPDTLEDLAVCFDLFHVDEMKRSPEPTHAMIEAGVHEFRLYEAGDGWEDTVAGIWRAMEAARGEG